MRRAVSGWLNRTEEWRRRERIAERERPLTLLLRPPLRQLNVVGLLLAAVGYGWILAEDRDSMPGWIEVVFLTGIVLILGTMTVELAVRFAVRRMKDRADGR